MAANASEKLPSDVSDSTRDEKPPTRAIFFSVPSLTGLRGVAALGVVAGHMTSGDAADSFVGGWTGVQELGNVAVIFFFALSAFLLTVRPLSENQKPAHAKYFKWSENGIKLPWLSLRWIKYLIRRVLRILPAYWLVLCIAAAVPVLQEAYMDFRNLEPFSWSKVPSWMFFRDVNSDFWTIPPEFEYYLVMPFFICLYEMAERKDKLGEWVQGTSVNSPGYPFGLGSVERELKEHHRKGLHNRFLHVYYRFGRRLLLLLALSLLNCLVVPLFWSSHGAYDYYHLPPFMAHFWLGSIAAFVYHLLAQYGYIIYSTESPPENQKFSQKTSRWIAIISNLICIALVVGLFLSFPWYARKLLHKYVPTTPFTWYADHMGKWPSLGSALMIFLVTAAARNNSFSKFFLWNVFMYCGEISFPLYMIHPPIIRHAMLHNIIGVDGVLFIYLTAIFFASIIHYLVERPAAKYGSKLCAYIEKRYFSKDPNLAAEVEELQVVTIDGGKNATDNARTFGSPPRLAVVTAPIGGPLVRVVPVGVLEDTHQKQELGTVDSAVEDDEAPLAAHRGSSRPKSPALIRGIPAFS